MGRFLMGISAGMFLTMLLHLFIPCNQAKTGHPTFEISQGKRGEEK